MPDEADSEWITVTEAMALTGEPQNAIWDAGRSGVVDTWSEGKGKRVRRYWYKRSDLIKWAAMTPEERKQAARSLMDRLERLEADVEALKRERRLDEHERDHP